MKSIVFLLGGLLSISAQAQVTAMGVRTNTNSVPLLKATVNGTVEVADQMTPSTTRVRTSTLNNNRIFQEFSVSKNDYELVLDANGAGLLELVPKSASAGLPTLQVLLLGGTKGLIDTKLSFGDVFDTLSSTATGNLFEGLGGAIRGRVTFKGSLSGTSITLKSFNFSVNAYGTDQGSGGALALLKFKVVGTGNFTQKP